MRRLTRLETGFLAASLAATRRLMERLHPDSLQPGYDGETLLLGSGMIDKTQTLVHLARYDGHLSRRFFRAIKQLRDLRRDEREAHEARTSAGSYAPVDPDPYRGRYVPAQAPPPIDPPSPTAGRIGFRTSRQSAPQPSLSKINDRAVPVRARAQQAALTEKTKQTQSSRTPVESTRSKDNTRSADLAVEIRGLCSAPSTIDMTPPAGAGYPHRAGNQHSDHANTSDSFCGAHSQCAASRLISMPESASITKNQTNPIPPNPSGIRAIQ